MKAKIYPSKNKTATIKLPCSKSLAHRAIICASLADGISHITNVDFSVDIDATISAMQHLGAKIEKKEHEVIVEGSSRFNYDGQMVNAFESGSTLRFLIPVFSLCDKEVTFIGSKRLMERPQSVYEKLFAKQNISFIHNDKITINGRLKSGMIEIDGNISSQFISGLLFTLPLLDNDSQIIIKPPFESKSYVDLTLQILKIFSVEAYYQDEYTLIIKGNQKYMACDYEVEADYSQLAFFGALGLINNDVECINFTLDSLQGDKQILNAFEKMNGIVNNIEDGFIFRSSDLHAATIDLQNCPDLGPMLFALATQAKGQSVFTNALRLRIKESDRIEAMEQELRKLNQKIYSSEDVVYVNGKNKVIAKEILSSHNDHRIVMALSILATISENVVEIDQVEAINKSYPKFFDDLRKCGIRVELYD